MYLFYSANLIKKIRKLQTNMLNIG